LVIKAATGHFDHQSSQQPTMPRRPIAVTRQGRSEDSMGRWIAAVSENRLRLLIHSPWRRPMLRDHLEEPTAIRTQFGAIFVSLELSQKTWLITSLSPGKGEKMSKHGVEARDVGGLMARFAELKRKAAARTGKTFPIIVIQEAGLDGFSIHRVLRQQGSRAMWSIRLRSRRRAGGDGPRRTGSTARRCCGRCWLSSAASRGSARWWSRLR